MPCFHALHFLHSHSHKLSFACSFAFALGFLIKSQQIFQTIFNHKDQMMLHLTQLGHHVLNVEKPLNDFQKDYAGHFHILSRDFEILSANKVFISTLNTNPVKGSILDQSMIKLINYLTKIFYFFILLICIYCFIVYKTKIIFF